MVDSGYIDSDGLKICAGDTLMFKDVGSGHDTFITGIVKYGEYADGEGYYNHVHCGWYIEVNNRWYDIVTLPDVMTSGDVHIISSIVLSRSTIPMW